MTTPPPAIHASAARAAAPDGPTGPFSVLVVDDLASVRSALVAELRHAGVPEILEAGTGDVALELFKQRRPDLVLLDIGMPGLNGEDVCRELRNNPHFAGLCVVAYTAHALPGDVERFLAAGFNAVLIKPISLQMVRDVIDGLFPR